MRRHFAAAAALILFAAMFSGTSLGAEAPEETIRRAREEREAAQAEQAMVARDLDVLEAEDDDMLAALAVLNEQIEAQQDRVAEAQANLERLAEEIGTLNDSIILTRQRGEIIRMQGVERAVQTYVQPTEPITTSILSGGDLQEATRRLTLFRFATLNDVEIRDGLRGVDAELVVLEAEVARKQIEAVAQEEALALVLADLDTNKVAQEALRAALAERITLIETQLAQMEAEEAELVRIIRQAQAEIAAREARNRQADLSRTSPSGLVMPAGGWITSAFGSRRHPILGTVRNHSGVDISGSTGNPVWAAQGGTVILAGTKGGYGNTVTIDHGGYVTLYAHMSRIRVSNGASVSQGTRIGDIGSTGLSTGPHLHFEVRVGGVPVNPASYLPG
ncbi:MAG: murein DD-endopeptidase MepM/ murein hydrolase activator NlpD [Candidatus Poriferisodalaceae bacterium]